MTTITTLSDCRGAYTLKAECDMCHHGKILDLETLIAALGPDVTIPELRRKMKCAKCGAKAPNVRVQLMHDGRPKD